MFAVAGRDNRGRWWAFTAPQFGRPSLRGCGLIETILPKIVVRSGTAIKLKLS
jgi:hypothetical protein